MNLWDSLGVTLEFRKKFNIELNYFSKEYQKIIWDSEKYIIYNGNIYYIRSPKKVYFFQYLGQYFDDIKFNI